jgi:hypothetical protein
VAWDWAVGYAPVVDRGSPYVSCIFWQYALTGDAFLNPYTLWWRYDKAGFGPDTGFRRMATAWPRRGEHLFSLRRAGKIFAGAGYSWIFLPFGPAGKLAQRSLPDPGARFSQPGPGVYGLLTGASIFGAVNIMKRQAALYAGQRTIAYAPSVRPGDAWPNYAGLVALAPAGD